jgi:hypothetical protein
LFAQYRLGIQRPQPRRLSHRLLTHHISLIDTGLSLGCKQSTTTPAVITDDIDLFHVPPADFKIRCATQTRDP